MASTTAHSTPQSPKGVGSAVQVRAIPRLTSQDPDRVTDIINQLVQQVNQLNGNNSYGATSVKGGGGGVGGLGGRAAAVLGGLSRSPRNAGKPKTDSLRQKQQNPLDPGNQQFGNAGQDKKDA